MPSEKLEVGEVDTLLMDGQMMAIPCRSIVTQLKTCQPILSHFAFCLWESNGNYENSSKSTQSILGSFPSTVSVSVS